MIRLNVHRESWQFVELMERWGFTRDTDLRRLIANGTISPYATFCRDLHPVSIVDGTPVVEPEPVPVQGDLWLVQALASKVDTFDFYYRILSDRPDPAQEDAQLWALPEAMDLKTVLLTFVVSNANVQSVEEAHGQKQPSEKSEAIKDRIIATFALDRFNWRGGQEVDFKGLTDVVDASKAYGMAVAYNTAKKYIREAIDHAKPTDLSRVDA